MTDPAAIVRIAIFGAALMAGGCATRSVGSTPAAGSAASPGSPAGPVEDVTVALTSDVPLPGEKSVGWHGLDAAEPRGQEADDGHEGHGGHALPPVDGGHP